MLMECSTVRKQTLDALAGNVSRYRKPILDASMDQVRRTLYLADLQDPDALPREEVSAAELRRTPTGFILPIHWWCKVDLLGLCDFSGDLDFTPLLLDQTLITLRGNFEIHERGPQYEVDVAQLGLLMLQGFLEGLTQ